MDGGVVDEFPPIGGEHFLGDCGAGGAGFFKIPHEDFCDAEGGAVGGALGDEIAIFLDGVPDAGTDGAEACEAYTQFSQIAHGRRLGG